MKRSFKNPIAMLTLASAMLIPQMAWGGQKQPDNGTGTASDPYVITSADELLWFRDHVNDGNTDACAKIADDVTTIDMSTICHAATSQGSNDELSWTPIGNETYKYSGTFDGNGKTISNLYIRTSKGYAGFFGNIDCGTIKNITFDNAKVENAGDNYTGILAGGVKNTTIQYITTLPTCSIKEKKYTGGILGYVPDQVSSSDQGCHIYNCENHATVNGRGHTGGIVGGFQDSNGSINSCANYGSVTSDYNSVGGIIGYFLSTAKNCANYGAVTGYNYVGGIAGDTSNGTLQNVLDYGDVTATGVSSCGLLVGRTNYYNSNLLKDACIYYSEATLTLNGKKQNPVAIGESSTAATSPVGYGYEDMCSGKVAYVLNGSTSVSEDGTSLAWYQKLGEDSDDYPVLVSNGNNTVYKASFVCSDGTVTTVREYANKPEGESFSHKFQIAKRPDAGMTNFYSQACAICRTVKDGTKYIKDFCGTPGNNITLSVEEDGTYKASASVTISDKAAYDSPVDFTASTLNYTREYLGNDKWQAVYVPFSMESTDWTDNGITVASINNFHEYELKEGGYETVLEVKKTTSGTLAANTPYVVRSSSDKENKTITIANATLHKATSDTYYCMSMTRKYDFTGIYQPQGGFNADGAASTVYVLNKEGNIAPLSSTATLGAQRWYLSVSDRTTSGSTQTMARSMRISMIGEGDPTGINDVQVTTSKGSAAQTGIYDLQGRRLSEEPTQGIYIKNGNKYIK